MIIDTNDLHSLANIQKALRAVTDGATHNEDPSLDGDMAEAHYRLAMNHVDQAIDHLTLAMCLEAKAEAKTAERKNR